jgi:hypothetical protein
MFGRSDRCDFMLEHPTVSRYHAGMTLQNNACVFLFLTLKTGPCFPTLEICIFIIWITTRFYAE